MRFPLRSASHRLLPWIVAGVLLGPSSAIAAPASEDERILPPVELPMAGRLPFVVDPGHVSSIAELAKISQSRTIRGPLRSIARNHFGRRRDADRRAVGLEEIRSHTGAASLFAMPFVLGDQGEDVRLAVLEHLADSGDAGQAAMVYAAVHHDDPAWRRAAAVSCPRPLGASALAVLEGAFRDGRSRTLDRAAIATGLLEARRMLPHLIVTQYAAGSRRGRGDLAWIAIGTQQAYVRNLVPVVGSRSGAFQPVPGLLTEGFVMRVTDAVAVVYRTEVHRVLVDLSSRSAGYDTASHGWAYQRWRTWYNEHELPAALADVEERHRAQRAIDFVDAERARRREAAEAAILD